MGEFGQLELIRESLVAVVNEMRANVIHSSYSSIIYEGHDFSCALLTADGRLVAQGESDNPIHIFAVPYSANEILKKFKTDINDGDIFLHNDPYTGGTHLNDILMLYPVFLNDELAMFAATRCHWGDVGGMTAGSLSGRVKEIYQEGMRIEPTRICEKGVMNDAFIDLLINNMRIRHERRGDFNTMLGTSRKAAEHIERLFTRFDEKTFLESIEELIDRSEKVTRDRLYNIPDGIYLAENYLDSNGHEPEPLLGKLKLTVCGDELIADFSGSSAQTNGPTNVGPAMALNAVASVVKSFLDPHTPVNHGVFNPIKIINPPGSFLNATLPAPCGGMVECRAIMIALMVSALGQALPDELVGDLKGGANHVYMSGPKLSNEEDSTDIFLLYEYPAGGTGATRKTDGNHAVRAYPEGDFNSVQSIEIAEMQCPVRIEEYSLREDSCGDGEFRGGCGMRRDVRILSDVASLSVLADHAVIPPFGVSGGHSGANNRFVVIRNGKTLQPSPIPGKVGSFVLYRDDIVRIETSGGGGFGDPLLRNPDLVFDDLLLGYITAETANQSYGLVLEPNNKKVNADATIKQREALKAQRLVLPLELRDQDDFDGPRRRIELSQRTADRLEVSEGGLVELSKSGSAAALRAWISIGGESGSICIGPTGIAALGLNPGEEVEIRALNGEV